MDEWKGTDVVDPLAARHALGKLKASMGLQQDAGPVTLGRYELGALLGTGTFGKVYRARDPNLGREVAIKVFPAEVLDAPRKRARARKEAQALASVEHPNVVRVFDSDVAEDPSGSRLYIVMEFIEGEPLDAWVARASPSSDQILDAFVHAGEGLQAAHDAGVLHMDFKPANVVRCGDGRVVVLDFGLARLVDPAPLLSLSAGGASLDLSGSTIAGTPAFMPPEQFETRKVGVTADVYALAASMLHLLCGESEPMPTTLAELVAKKRELPVLPPGVVDERVAEVLLRALLPRADRRFPTVRAMLRALARARRPRSSVPSFGGETTISRDRGSFEEVHIRRGAEVGRYVILDRLGAGAMGAVYAAFDPRLDRQVAVKILRHRTDRHVDELLDEARALARLAHPNVVSVYDAGLYRESVYITMEKVEGQTLDDWGDANPRRGWREVLGVLLGAGRGLAAAHQAGTVHRDFKPANVMVNTNALTKVMDFGLASLVGGDEKNLHIQGTPLYMAPEQYLDRSASFASDQFAFCLVAYEALGGTHPRRGAGSSGELIDRMREDVPQLTCPGLPPKVRAAIMRGLSFEASQRWPSMDPLLEVCARGLRGAGPRWLGMATIASLAGVAWAVAAVDGEDPCPDPAVAAEALVSEASRDEIVASLEGFDAMHGIHRAGLVMASIETYARDWAKAEARACESGEAGRTALEVEASSACLERHRNDFLGAVAVLRTAQGVERVRAADLIEELPDPRSCLEGDVPDRGVEPPEPGVAGPVAEQRRALAELRAENAVGRWVGAAQRVEPILSSARELGYPPLIAEALLVRGEALRRLHEIEEAEQALTDAVVLALEHGDRRLALQACLGLVALRRELSDTDENRAWARRARRLITGGSDPTIEAQLDLHLSTALRNIGEFEAARAHAESAVSVMRTVLGEDHRRYAEARHTLGAAMYRLGDDGALGLALETLELRERLLGPRHPEVASSLLLVGVIRGARAEFAEAEAAYLRAIEIERSVVGSDSRVLAGAYSNLGDLYGRMERPDEGREMVAMAIDIWRERNQIDSLIYGLNVMGGLMFRAGDCASMLAHYAEAWSMLAATGGPHPLRSRIGLGVGAAHVCLGDFEEAEPWLARADEADDLPPTADRLRHMWQALYASHVGDTAEARRRAHLVRAYPQDTFIPQRWLDALEEAVPTDPGAEE